MKQALIAFPQLMRAFFYEWLVEQRNASMHTVRSYRDTLGACSCASSHQRRCWKDGGS
jgi:site-specific recombinase XerD